MRSWCLERSQTILCYNSTQSRARVTESGFSHFKTGVYNLALSQLFSFICVLIHSFVRLTNNISSMNTDDLRPGQGKSTQGNLNGHLSGSSGSKGLSKKRQELVFM